MIAMTRPTRKWSKYNQQLVQRGRIDFWIQKSALKRPARSGKKGRPLTYSDAFIESCLTLKSIFHLAFRQLEGFLHSIATFLPTSKIPDFTTIAERSKSLNVSLTKRDLSQPVTLVLDASGLKIYGPGEWMRRAHYITKRRGWMKLHVGLDAKTQQVCVFSMTDHHTADCAVGPRLIECCSGEIDRVLADKAYDAGSCYQAAYVKGARAVIPPRKGSVFKEGSDHAAAVRNEHIDRIRRQRRGHRRWAKEEGYNLRVLVETFFSVFKRVLGPALRSKRVDTQWTEVRIGVNILNKLRAQVLWV